MSKDSKLATVHPLPIEKIEQAEQGEVVDGEIVSEAEYARVMSQREQALARWQGYRTDVVVVAKATRTVATHQVTKAAVRELLYVPVGVGVVARRVWEAKTNSRYERLMRSAEVAGDFEALKEWEQRAEAARQHRHARRMDWIESPFKFIKAIGAGLGLGFGGLLGLGIVVGAADKNAHEVRVPLMTAAHLVKDMTVVAGVAWGPLVLAAPWLFMGWLWREGRRYGSAPTWLTAPVVDGPETGAVVTADTMVLALQHLRIPELKKAFKNGWVPKFYLQPVRDGRGYHLVVDLPLGVTAGMVADQRDVLARNLHRAEVEVWPSDAEKAGSGPAGSLDVWVADSGALSKAAPEYPLLHEGQADVFTGVPAGVSPRGDVIFVPVTGNNFTAGGMMGQGKSNACRVTMLGGALDPLAELWVYVFAGNGDFDAYAPRLARYHRGATPEVAAAGLQSLHDLYAEVGRREARLAELGAKKVTRQLAVEHPDLRPIMALYSECHELFGDKELGEQAADIAVQTLRRARKTGIWLGFDTQSSRKDAIPPKVVELVSVNACFAVKSWRSNDGFLGDGSFAAGIRATELRPTTDRGTSLITGVSDAPFELLRWYFIEVNDDTGFDAATDVIARALDNVAPGTRVESNSPAKAVETRDLFDDLDEVLGVDKVRLADVPAMLRKLAPAWTPYQTLTGAQLRDLLTDAGVRTTTTGNVLRLDPVDLRRVLATRSTADLDEE